MNILSVYLLIGGSFAGVLVGTGRAARSWHVIRLQARARGQVPREWVPYASLLFVMLAWPVFLAMVMMHGGDDA